MIITSAGIYGLLSSGYQVTADKLEVNKATIENIEKKKALFTSQKEALEQELSLINTNLNDLRKSGSSTITEQVYDKKTKQYVTKAVRVPAKFIEKQINTVSEQKTDKDTRLSAINDSIFAYESQVLDLKTNDEVSAEIGPLIYLSKITGQSMDKVINWFLLLIIFVFDPLAIALVISANFLFAKLSKKEIVVVSKVVTNVPEPIQTAEVIEPIQEIITEPAPAATETEYVEEAIPTTYEEINQKEETKIVSPPPKVNSKSIPRLSDEQMKWMTEEQIKNYNKQFDE
jgi:chaperonin cofactor prefoldin